MAPVLLVLIGITYYIKYDLPTRIAYIDFLLIDVTQYYILVYQKWFDFWDTQQLLILMNITD